MQERVSPESEPGLLAPRAVLGTGAGRRSTAENQALTVSIYFGTTCQDSISALPEEKETQPGMFQRDSPTGGGTSSSARGPLSLTREDGKVYPLDESTYGDIYRNNDPLATNVSPHPV